MGGVLPYQTIQRLMNVGNISGIHQRNINPSSLDVPASEEAYRLVKTFIPKETETIREMLEWAGATPHNLATPLEVGVSYLVRLDGLIRLFPNEYGYWNPKSSTGRLNLFVRVMADKVTMYDALPLGWSGETWMLVQPCSFPILLTPGIALAQVRFFDEKAFLDQTDLLIANKEQELFFDRDGGALSLTTVRAHADALFLSIRADKGVVGWECAGSSKILDLREKHHYRPEDFSFKPIKAEDNEIVLLPGRFYILTTEESVRVPPGLAAELRATDPRLGEFRSHFAGFVDSGWGYGKTGDKKGQPITLEITTSEKQLSLRHKQPIARIRFERMSERPQVLYDDGKSNYTGQVTAQLSKHFNI